MNNFNDFNKNADNNLLQNLSNENFINMANKIDTISLNNLGGTSIMDLNNNYSNNQNSQINMPNTYQNMQGMQGLPVMQSQQTHTQSQSQSQPMYNMNSNSNPENQNKTLIKSITKELINNLKENNISLHDDNSSLNSSSSKTKSKTKSKSSKNKNKYIDKDVFDEDLEDLEDVDNLLDQDQDDSFKTDKEDYKKILKRNVENMMTENNIPESSNLTSYIFDDLFNLKEVALLFGLYFLLSQEMIKDLFSQYFTSLNPDDMGRVGVKGVIIYGLILTILFMVLKKVV
jgi:hypothetical protein